MTVALMWIAACCYGLWVGFLIAFFLEDAS